MKGFYAIRQKNRPLSLSILIMSVLLVGCASNVGYSNDAYPVTAAIYKDGTCELSVDGKLYIVRDDSYTDLFDSAPSFSEIWRCGNFPRGDEVRIYASISGGKDPLSKRQVFDQTEKTRVVPKTIADTVLSPGQISSKLSLEVSGPSVNNLKPPFHFLRIATFFLYSTEMTIIWDPDQEKLVSVTAVAQRGDML